MITESLNIESQRIEEDCTYSSKGHYAASAFWARVQIIVGLPATILAAISGSFAFSGATEIAGSVAMLAAGLTAVLTFLNPSDKASSHLMAGNQYSSLKNESRVFREVDLVSTEHEEKCIEALKSLSTRRNKLNQTSPQIPGFAFRIARKGVLGGEANYSADKGN